MSIGMQRLSRSTEIQIRECACNYAHQKRAPNESMPMLSGGDSVPMNYSHVHVDLVVICTPNIDDDDTHSQSNPCPITSNVGSINPITYACVRVRVREKCMISRSKTNITVTLCVRRTGRPASADRPPAIGRTVGRPAALAPAFSSRSTPSDAVGWRAGHDTAANSSWPNGIRSNCAQRIGVGWWRRHKRWTFRVAIRTDDVANTHGMRIGFTVWHQSHWTPTTSSSLTKGLSTRMFFARGIVRLASTRPSPLSFDVLFGCVD